MIYIGSVNNLAYEALAKLTDKHRQEYADKHGYTYVPIKEGFIEPITDAYVHDTSLVGFEKVHSAIKIFDKYPDCSHLWMPDVDTLITNMTIKLEDILSKYPKPFLVGTDCNGINTGNFIVSREWGYDFLKFIVTQREAYRGNILNEQAIVIDNYAANKGFIERLPQRVINSYEYGLYDFELMDILGNNGQWQPGDFNIHWPGQSLETRINLALKYAKLTIK